MRSPPRTQTPPASAYRARRESGPVEEPRQAVHRIVPRAKNAVLARSWTARTGHGASPARVNVFRHRILLHSQHKLPRPQVATASMASFRPESMLSSLWAAMVASMLPAVPEDKPRAARAQLLPTGLSTPDIYPPTPHIKNTGFARAEMESLVIIPPVAAVLDPGLKSARALPLLTSPGNTSLSLAAAVAVHAPVDMAPVEAEAVAELARAAWPEVLHEAAKHRALAVLSDNIA